jgi:hypothetical protein
MSVFVFILLILLRGRILSRVIPHFNYRFVNVSRKRVPCIEVDGKVFHEIRELDRFYAYFGFSPATCRPDMLPDEFIWSEYTNSPSERFSDCVQIHIMRYLKDHSDTFNREYGELFDALLARHVTNMAQMGEFCIACKMRSPKKVE